MSEHTTNERPPLRRVTWEDIDQELERLREHSQRRAEEHERALLDLAMNGAPPYPFTIRRYWRL